jgi:hypothetical protein
MGKYLDIIRRAETEREGYDRNDINDQRGGLPAGGVVRVIEVPARGPSQFRKVLAVLQTRCPVLVPVERWQQCVEDGRAFLAQWGEQAALLGWTSADLFGLHTPPDKPHPSYNRLSRYDQVGLCWLLQGRCVVAITESTAAIENPVSSSVTIYRRYNKPALGPLFR